MKATRLKTMDLVAHPACPPLHAEQVRARMLSLDCDWCVLRWTVQGVRDLLVPDFAGRARADGLWQTTCFELFVAGPDGGTEYAEYNFSPSERWAAYDFIGYRAGMRDRAMPRAPVITPRRGGDVLICDVAIPADCLPPLPLRYGLTAVLEETGGVKSYWASAHPRAAPDFHDPACLGGVHLAPDGS